MRAGGLGVVVALALLPAAAPAATPRDEVYDCASILALVQADVKDAAHASLALSPPPDQRGDVDDGRCDAGEFEHARGALHAKPGASVEAGWIAKHRAAVWSDGPHGSGHFWQLAIAVELDGRAVGTCVGTATAGWRNIPGDGVRVIGTWQTLVGGELVVWRELAAGHGSEAESLIDPVVYRLDGRTHALVLDGDATRAAIARFGHAYARIATLRDDPAPELHRGAAAAYAAFAAGAACRP
jgi:hypothetical protein